MQIAKQGGIIIEENKTFPCKGSIPPTAGGGIKLKKEIVIITEQKNSGKNLVKYIVLSLALSTLTFSVKAQTEAKTEITIIGYVTDLTTGFPLTGALVVQQSQLRGTFTDGRGYFSIQVVKTDTLIFTLTGYQSQKVCYADSAGTRFAIDVRLPQKTYALRPVTVRPLKTFEEIERDKSMLGSNRVPTMRTAEALSSPITFLYERFSKFERNKRKVAELRNLEEKRDLLKELFRIYTKANILDLEEEEFDDFIIFMNLSEDFIKNASQYDLTQYIKLKFDEYMWVKKQKR